MFQSHSQQEESEKLKHQCSSLSKKLITLQHEYETKERQIQQLTETLDHARKENYELQKAIDEYQNHEQQIEFEVTLQYLCVLYILIMNSYRMKKWKKKSFPWKTKSWSNGPVK